MCRGDARDLPNPHATDGDEPRRTDDPAIVSFLAAMAVTSSAPVQPASASGSLRAAGFRRRRRQFQGGSLDHGAELDQGWPPRHGAEAEAEADRRLDRSQRAKLDPVERGTGGDEGVQIVGAVPLATSVAGTTMGTDPGSSPRAGRSSRPTHQVVRARVASMAHNSRPSGLRRPMVNESCSRGLARSRCRPWSVWAATTRRPPGPPTPRSSPRCRTAAWRSSTDPATTRSWKSQSASPPSWGRSSSVARTLRAQELEHLLIDLLGLVHGQQMPGTRQQLRLQVWHQPGGVSQSALGVEGLLLVAHQQQGRNRDRS
jgi:hypothetical protein